MAYSRGPQEAIVLILVQICNFLHDTFLVQSKNSSSDPWKIKSATMLFPHPLLHTSFLFLFPHKTEPLHGQGRASSSTELAICSSLSLSLSSTLFFICLLSSILVAWVVGGCLDLFILSLMGVERWRQELCRDCHHGAFFCVGMDWGSKTDLAYTHTVYLLGWVDGRGCMDGRDMASSVHRWTTPRSFFFDRPLVDRIGVDRSVAEKKCESRPIV